MEWHFCYGDGNCWATWFWSSSTAAWVQAILTAVAIFWSIHTFRVDQIRTREMFEKEKSDARSEAKRKETANAYRAVLALQSCEVHMDGLYKRLPSDSRTKSDRYEKIYIESGYFLSEQAANLQELMKLEYPDRKMYGLLNLAIYAVRTPARQLISRAPTGGGVGQNTFQTFLKQVQDSEKEAIEILDKCASEGD